MSKSELQQEIEVLQDCLQGAMNRRDFLAVYEIQSEIDSLVAYYNRLNCVA